MNLTKLGKIKVPRTEKYRAPKAYSEIRIFRNGQVERGSGCTYANPRPDYAWHQAYSQINENGAVSMMLTLCEWQDIAKRDGAKLVRFESEAEARKAKL